MDRSVLELPDIEGYSVLKADFHLHTVFSDGYVWPTTRVEEAFLEGLDAIAITDHLEYRPKASYFSSNNHNQAYEIAENTAKRLGIILIRGTEITRDTSAGHFNAIFIKDANSFEKFVNKQKPSDPATIKEALDEAKKQGGFVFWNHPWDKQPGTRAIWHPVHTELLKMGLINGIEVNNRDRYYPEIFKWCNDYNLTLISNTDAHNPLFRLEEGSYRSMTIIFANERSASSIQQALINRQTVAYSQNYIYGDEKFVKLLFANAVFMKTIHTNDKSFIVELKNKAGIPYNIEVKDTDGLNISQKQFILKANGNCALILDDKNLVKGKTYRLKVEVKNAHIAPDKALMYEFNLIP
ncbi:MAG: CehA/McbA family metallohydrolase [Bacteroidales bacterium]|nr:CehA/McbA family metallohydrolase [Bacteroidales bacterium]